MPPNEPRRGRAVILTALPVEYAAVRAHLSNLQEKTHRRGTVYEQGNFIAGEWLWEIGIGLIGAGNSTAASEADVNLDIKLLIFWQLVC